MRQRLWFSGLLLLAAIAVPATVPSAEIKKGPLAAGKNIPATFHPYNVTARVIPPEELELLEEEKDKEKGKEKDADEDGEAKKPVPTSKGKFHCLITEYDLDPVVMLFARNLEENKAFRDLLKKLDEECTRKRSSRLRAFVVFLSDDLPSFSVKGSDQNDTLAKQAELLKKQEELVKKIEQVQDGLKLANVVLTLGARDDLAKYQLDDSVALTAVLYRNLRIQASRTVSRDQLDEVGGPEIKALLADVPGKLLPRK
jgi:hypothetical protein